MRYVFRRSGIAALCFVILWMTVVLADKAEISTPQSVVGVVGKEQPDKPPGSTDEPVLERILQNWQLANSKINRIDTNFSYRRFDAENAVVGRGKGRFSIDTTGRGKFTLGPAENVSGQFIFLRSPDGRKLIEYESKPAEACQWHWTGKNVICVEQNGQSYYVFELPLEVRRAQYHPSHPQPPSMPESRPTTTHDQYQTETVEISGIDSRARAVERKAAMALAPEIRRIAFGHYFRVSFKKVPLTRVFKTCRLALFEAEIARPFLFAMPLIELNSRYEITLNAHSDTELHLQFLSKQQLMLHKKALLILTRDTYVPRSLHLTDWSGDIRTEYVFDKMRVNIPPDEFDRLDLRGFCKQTSPI
ncbi:MAG: hypothetical protein JWM11_1561 [Planctomycetaceae bacterium]|nr:hypothetical protein [Planctomycetaceae bacterium]